MMPDAINGLFEALAGVFILNHCRALWRDKRVAGVSLLSVSFFFCWGLWNLFYYPTLGQGFSFAGGIVVVLANFMWAGLILHYRSAEQPVKQE